MNKKFSMDVQVLDKQELFKAAMESALEDGLSESEAKSFLIHDDPPGEIDVGACIIQLTDPGSMPGCEILGSEVESALELGRVDTPV